MGRRLRRSSVRPAMEYVAAGAAAEACGGEAAGPRSGSIDG